MTLHQLRDVYLLENKLGKKFVQAYYRYSSAIADFNVEHEGLRSMARVGLAPFVGFSWIAINFGMMVALIVLLGLLIIFIGGTCCLLKTGESS